MVIKKIKLINYRNYDNLELELNSKLNIFIGDNAQGKTNILESIYVLSITKSFLNINEKNLIKFGCDYSLIESNVITGNVKKKLRVLINSKGKQVSINGRDIKKISEYISNLKVIVFSPDNIKMLKDGPSVRRKFLNIEISQLNINYIKYLMDYNNIISQKNEYLKISNEKDLNYIDVLNDKISELSVRIVNLRKIFINELNNYISSIFFEITGIDGLRLKYLSNVEILDDEKLMTRKLREKLNVFYEKEKNYKVSLIGPHRDDFIFMLDGKNLSLYGSQGQLRCAILSLKLAEVKVYRDISDDYPILLLDDIFSELDVDKKNNLIKYINDDVQTIITTTDLDLINEELIDKASIFKIKNAKLFPGK